MRSTRFSFALAMLLWSSNLIADEPAATGKSYKLVFNGTDNYVRVPKLGYDGSHPITIEAIVIPFAQQPAPVRTAVIGNVEASGVGISCKPTDWRFNVNDGRPFDLGYAYAHSDKAPESLKQVHVAGVFDGKELKMFVDGKLQAITGKTMAAHNASTFDFMIGADPDDEDKPQHFFKGAIDEVRVSKVVRYNANFPVIRDKFKPDADTMLLYHFDEGTGQIAKDASKNRYDGEIVGAKWVEAPEVPR